MLELKKEMRKIPIKEKVNDFQGKSLFFKKGSILKGVKRLVKKHPDLVEALRNV